MNCALTVTQRQNTQNVDLFSEYMEEAIRQSHPTDTDGSNYSYMSFCLMDEARNSGQETSRSPQSLICQSQDGILKMPRTTLRNVPSKQQHLLCAITSTIQLVHPTRRTRWIMRHPDHSFNASQVRPPLPNELFKALLHRAPNIKDN